MHETHEALFAQLCASKDVIIVTGGAEEQIRKQIPLDATGNYFMLSQQGNFAVHKDGTELWHETVSDEQVDAVRIFARKLTDTFIANDGITLTDENDIFENRGSQLASSVLGFHETNEKKYAADPDQSKRRALLALFADDVAKLRTIGIDVMPAGTTTFDFILSGKNKGHNITRLLASTGWSGDDCIYYGDALFPGGNDETVIGVIATQVVTDPEHTFTFIAQMLS